MSKIIGKKIENPLKDGERQFTILIVEDDQDLRESLVVALRDEGYHAISAQDAAEAIQCVQQRVRHSGSAEAENPGVEASRERRP